MDELKKRISTPTSGPAVTNNIKQPGAGALGVGQSDMSKAIMGNLPHTFTEGDASNYVKKMQGGN